MKKQIVVKKLKLYPMGDKEEVSRVYQYIRNAQYTYYRVYNAYMGRVASAYYKYRDVKDPEYVSTVKEYRTGHAEFWNDFDFPKGLDLKSAVVRKVSNDFSNALKSGLAKGDKSISYMKRGANVPSAGRAISVFVDQYTNDNGETKERYCIKWVNKIKFKVMLGAGKRDYGIVSLLDELADQNPDYKICTSNFDLDGKNIYLKLCVEMPAKTDYIPEDNKVMKVELAFDSPLLCSIVDSDNPPVAVSVDENFVPTRLKIQEAYKRDFAMMKYNQGGHGQKKKLIRIENLKKREKNFVRQYNHKMSRSVVDLAMKNKADTILITDITWKDLEDNPFYLRNWSYYQLYEFIKYKAAMVGIKFLKEKSVEEKKDIISEEDN